MRHATQVWSYRPLQEKKLFTYPNKMKKHLGSKAFVACVLLTVLVFLYNMVFKDYNYSQITPAFRIVHVDKNNRVVTEVVNSVKRVVKPTEGKGNLKYILQWTSPKSVPFVYMGVGQQGFIDRNCSYTNCFVTANRMHLDSYEDFDVIAFSGPAVSHDWVQDVPRKRSSHQKYVFASIESAANYPVCYEKYDNFFNWTWTYKLDSEAKWGYIVVRDAKKNIIGPKKEMHWMKLEDMDPVNETFKKQLQSKRKAAAWFVSNCQTKSRRETFVTNLQRELQKYDLNVDVYGKCGSLDCSRDKQDQCLKILSNDYYFYLSFENSFSEDYVTEKLIHGLQNNAVPIVYGGANYTRFMPDGIYLNARELGVQKLAEKMNSLILNFDKYVEYFKWKNHYSFHRRYESLETDDYCRFCSILNEDIVNKTSVYENFREWWNEPNKC